MPAWAPSRAQWAEIGAAALIVAIPIALIGATWEPLEPPPRPGRARSADERPDPAADKPRAVKADDNNRRERPERRTRIGREASATPSAP